MAAIAFPASSYPGEKPLESAGRLINAQAQELGPGKATAAKIGRVAGIKNYVNTGQSTFRGAAVLVDTLYAAYDGKLYEINDDETATELDDLAGDGFVSFAANNATTPNRIVVTENGAFNINPSTGEVTSFADGDLPQPTDVCSGFNFFFFPIANGQCFSTGLGAVTVDANDYITAEAKPDNLLRGVFVADNLFLCGTDTIEIWGTPINDSGFPLNRKTVIPRGIAAKEAITGYQDGFSKGIYFVGDDRVPYTLDGYSPVPLRHPDVVRAIARLSDISTLMMHSWLVDGNAFVAIKCPSFTWVYDVTNGTWHERRSRSSGVQLDYWRCDGTVRAFNKWLAFDTETGLVGEIRGDTYREFGDDIVWEVESLPVENFPNGAAVREANFQMVVGQGLAAGEDRETDPQVDVSWSDDGGNTWSQPRRVPLGALGDYERQVPVHLTGRTGQKGRKWRLQVSAPIYVSLFGGDQSDRPRRA